MSVLGVVTEASADTESPPGLLAVEARLRYCWKRACARSTADSLIRDAPCFNTSLLLITLSSSTTFTVLVFAGVPQQFPIAAE